MFFHAFLIKYGEIGIKGKNRYLFEDALVAQIRHALKHVEGTFKVTKDQGRIYVHTEGEYDYDDAVAAMRREMESSRWAYGTIAAQTALAWTLATLVFQLGRLLGLG